MPLFSLPLSEIDWGKTKDLGLFVLAAYAAVLSTITALRGRKTIRPMVTVESKNPRSDASIERTLSVLVSNRGNHAFTIRKIEGLTVDGTVAGTIYDVISASADSKMLSPEQVETFVMEELAASMVYQVVVTLTDGSQTTHTVPEPEHAVVLYAWVSLVQAVAKHLMKGGEVVVDKNLNFGAINVTYDVQHGAPLHVTIWPFATNGHIGGFRKDGHEPWAVDFRKFQNYRVFELAASNENEVHVNWSTGIDKAIREDDTEALARFVEQLRRDCLAGGVPPPKLYDLRPHAVHPDQHQWKH